MKYLRILLFFLYLGTVVHAQNLVSPESVNWVRNVDYAQTLALRYNKPVFLYFQNYPSTALEKNVYSLVFSNETIVTAINDKFIPLFVLADSPLALQYNIKSFPTVLVMDLNTNRTLGKLSGALLAPSSVANLLRSALTYTQPSPQVVVPRVQGQARLQGQAQIQRPTQIQNPVIISPTNSITVPTGFIYNTPSKINATIQFVYDGGRFISYNNGTWINQTPFSEKPFYQYNFDERHLYLANNTNTVFVAVPRTARKNIWLWDEVSESWMIYKMVSVIETIQ